MNTFYELRLWHELNICRPMIVMLYTNAMYSFCSNRRTVYSCGSIDLDGSARDEEPFVVNAINGRR